MFTIELFEEPRQQQRACDSPRGAGAAKLIRRACGRTHFVRTVAAVVLVVAHPVGGDASAPGAGKFRIQTGRGGRWARHAVAPPHTILAGAEHRKNYFSGCVL